MGSSTAPARRSDRGATPRIVRLLLIEDVPEDAELIDHALRRAGCRAQLTRVDTEAAFVAHLASPPDAVLADFRVPGCDVFRVLDRLREEALDIPLIVVSGTLDDETAVRVLQAGAVDYLRKDRLERLGSAVLRALDERRVRVQSRLGHRALQRREALLRGLMDAAPNAIVITDADGRITLANAEAGRMFGYEPTALVGRPVETLVPEAVRERHRAHRKAYDGRPRRYRMAEALDTEGRHHDGATFPVEITLSPYQTEEGTFFISIIQDVTVRRRVEETLRESEKKYRALFNAIPDPVFIFDLETHFFIDCNEAVHRVYGYSRDELVGMTPFDLHPPEEQDLVRENIAVTGGHEPVRYTHVTRDGARFFVEILSNEIDYDGRRASVSIVRDVTAQQQASRELEQYAMDLEDARAHFEDQANQFALMFHELDEAKRAAEEARKEVEAAHARLQESQAQLVQSEKMASLGQLAAGVAHEINNPIGFVTSNLNTLAGYVETFKALLALYQALADALPEPRTPEQQALLGRLAHLQEEEDLAFILEDVDFLIAESSTGLIRVKEIVQNLKNFARADEPERQETDLNAGIEATLRVIWNELKYKCEVVTEYGDLPRYRCHPGQLNQVFMNLLVNAAQAIEERGTITIATGVEDDHIVVRISDTGCGIPEEHLENLFNPFFTTKPVGKGTGLGLSISFGIVRKHGGRIEVESTVGRGTTFSVWLPLGDASADAPEEDPT